MKLTTQDMILIIKDINTKIELLNDKVNKQTKLIKELREENVALKTKNQTTLNQIKEYIKELEQIRNHYVGSNNKY